MLGLTVRPAAADAAGLTERLAAALMARDEVATVWLSAEGRPSRIALDIAAPSREAAADAALALVVRVAGEAGARADITATWSGTDAERLGEFAAGPHAP